MDFYWSNYSNITPHRFSFPLAKNYPSCFTFKYFFIVRQNKFRAIINIHNLLSDFQTFYSVLFVFKLDDFMKLFLDSDELTIISTAAEIGWVNITQ